MERLETGNCPLDLGMERILKGLSPEARQRLEDLKAARTAESMVTE